MKKVFRYVPKWSSIKIIGNSYPAKLSIIMPFLGYIILSQEYVENIISRMPFSKAAVFFGHIPSLQFYFFYFGLFIFGVGSLIFFLSCDRILKNNSDSDAFYINKSPTCTANELVIYCKYIASNFESGSQQRKTADLIVNSLTTGVQNNVSAESRLFALKTYYEIKDEKLIPIRIIVCAMFAAGLTLLVIPSIITFYWVFILFAHEFL